MDQFKFDEVIDFVEAHPERYCQLTWVTGNKEVSDEHGTLCGSKACIAGWAALLNGWKLVYNRYGEANSDVVRDGIVKHISTAGQNELELTSPQADYMFHGDRDLDEIKELGKALANNPDLDPEYDSW